jgi:hypothetical protein
VNAEVKTIKTRADEWADTKPVAHPYLKLRDLNVSDKIEKKNGLSYLSWAFAVDTLLKEDPGANWEFPPSEMYGETMMVRCAVTAFGKTMTAHLPVMNHMNKAIANPNAFEVNTALQRCLVKAIALHGIGLYIYAGEDLPAGSDAKGDLGKDADRSEVERGVLDFRTAFNLDASEEDIAEAVLRVHERVAAHTDLYVAIADGLNPRERNAIKEYVRLAKVQQSVQTANGRAR